MQRGGAVEARVGIGEALAEARYQAGLTVTEVSQRTGIRETIIRGIEGDDYSACGGDLYARANIRSIAGAVGADPEPLIREYDEVCLVPGVLSAVSLDELFTVVQTSGRRRVGWTPVLGLALVIMLGSVGFVLLSGSRHEASIPPAAADHEVTHVGSSSSSTPDHPATVAPTLRPTVHARTLTTPAATVLAYVAAINGHDYARAWSLGGRNTGQSYSNFVSGFSMTARDALTIVSVSSDVVTARLTAQQTDGTVDTYQGTYTVHRGVIIGFNVVQAG